MAIIIITEFIEGLLCKATNLVVVWAWSHDNEVLYWTKGLCQDSCAPVLHPLSILRTWGQAAQTPGDTAHSVLPVRPGENLVTIKVPLPKTSPHSPRAAPSYILGLEILVLLHVTLPGAEFIRFILHPHGSPPAHVSPQSLTAHSPATGSAGPYDRLVSA